MTRSQADELVAQLELDLDGVCHACLCVVSFALEDGEPRKLAGALRQMTPDLWADGLDAQALAAAERACELDLPHAREALADLEQHGGRGIVARAIVKRLAAELSARTRRRPEEAAMN
jgi:hypothetical protein